jgi:dolichol kinase
MKRTAEAKVAHLFSLNSVRLPFRSDLNLMRKVWHMGMGLVIVYLYLLGIPQSNALLILSACLAGDLFIENARLRSPVINQRMMRLWGTIMRSHEVNQMSTIPHYIVAVILAIGLFPKPVAVLSILYLACGDPVASLFGILYGHKGPRFKNGKTLIGTGAGILVCTLISYFYLQAISITHSNTVILMVSLLGGLAGGLAELIPFEIDDNFTIPVVSGFLLWLVFIAFGI